MSYYKKKQKAATGQVKFHLLLYQVKGQRSEVTLHASKLRDL